MPRLMPRNVPPEVERALKAAGVHPVLARLAAARGVVAPEELSARLAALLPYDGLRQVKEAARLLAEAIQAGKRLLIVADYDADGATACAVGLRALTAFGARVDYLVPNRFETGYGLTAETVELAAQLKRPDLLMTVDNGIAAVEAVETARRLGIEVVITDHHLPGPVLPRAAAIVNPHQPQCPFPSKALAGVGVLFYLMLALRAELRARGAFTWTPEPNLARLLPLVALGTVADVVKLDRNNRILVHQGLARIRALDAPPGVLALFQVAGRDPRRASTHDLGFCLGPRLNAAGRLADMGLGIECLTTDDPARAQAIAEELNRLNALRRDIEADMHEAALEHLEDFDPGNRWSLALYEPSWHQGVIGILASRLKERFHRPVIAFAPGQAGELKGSGRSIPGLHLRDALDLVAKRQPGLIVRFGGHAAAAGLTLPAGGLEAFREAFEACARELLTEADLEQVLETDGPLDPQEATLELARLLARHVWGQGFPEPLFDDCFQVESQRVVAGRHLKLKLAKAGVRFDAMLFSHAEELPSRIRAAYRLEVNEFNGEERVQLTLRHWEPA
ncbi:single-stranded-DNA-specific exonuclease RecJ [Pelomicrobium sp.]|uniref:single-stranded-DNA-specific exonuclease RecJ n=1 Tax=Pelomicrobium sp. TaxID=2815319 RepID=UPI002FDEC1AD